MKPVTVSSWATAAPKDFLTTALSELEGTSGIATYGPPYTNVPGAGQNIIGGFSIQRAVGVRIPINTANAFVLGPLSRADKPRLAIALRVSRPRRGKHKSLDRRLQRSPRRPHPSGRARTFRRLRAAAGADGQSAHNGAERGARRRAPLDVTLLPDRPHEAAPLPLRRRLPRRHRGEGSICSAASGE